MINSFSRWFQQRFVGTDLGALCFILILLIIGFWSLSRLLLPVLVSVVFAYLLAGLVKRLVYWKVPRNFAVYTVYLLFLGVIVFSLFFLIPMLWEQLSLLVGELPTKFKQAEGYMNELLERYPGYISKTQIEGWLNSFQDNFSQISKNILTFSVSTVSVLMTIIVYLILVPLMVYFFMKDSDSILHWFSQFLPKKRTLMKEVWLEIDLQMGHYISAKIIEMIIVGAVTTIAFLLLGLNYSVLLGVLVGISAIIPYVGVILVTIPVVVVGYMQWGLDVHFLYLMITYIALMILDGNILTPLLFAETMNLHPVAVIIAVLMFGGLWGFWGIFFAIPLASVIQVLLNAWLRHERSLQNAA